MGLFRNMNDMYKAGGEPLGKGRHAARSERMAGAQAKMAANATRTTSPTQLRLVAPAYFTRAPLLDDHFQVVRDLIGLVGALQK